MGKCQWQCQVFAGFIPGNLNGGNYKRFITFFCFILLSNKKKNRFKKKKKKIMNRNFRVHRRLSSGTGEEVEDSRRTKGHLHLNRHLKGDAHAYWISFIRRRNPTHFLSSNRKKKCLNYSYLR